MGLPWMPLVLILVVLQRSSVSSSYPGEGEGGTDTAVTLRSDCPSKCGDVPIPYPFGLSEDCSLPGFKVDCGNTSVGLKPKMKSEYFLSISLLQAQARVLIKPSKVCESVSDSSGWWVDLSGTPFTFSDKLNSFTAIGCDTLALLKRNVDGNYTGGCATTCGENTGAAKRNKKTEDQGQDQENQVIDGKCSGIGCCQSSVPGGLSSYYTLLRHLNVVANNTSIQNTAPESCGFAFVVENANYTFKKKDLDGSSNISDWILQAVLDWTIGNQTCEQAKKNDNSYACKSINSECVDSVTGIGYVCNCSQGYYGNPYLHRGCQDIDECGDANRNPCYHGLTIIPGGINQTCNNLMGSYNCSCPLGFTIAGDLCAPITQDRSKAAIGIIIGVSCGSVSLLFLVIVGLARKKLRKKRMDRWRQKYFRQNYDLLLQQQLIYGENKSIVDILRFFSMKKLEKATEKFDCSRIVGNGGHGTVYKGILDLQVVAIKKSKLDIRIEAEQFINEIILLSQINHRNVVKLIGCCLEAEVPLLVYEFVSNGTLFHHLHDSSRGNSLSWDDRLRIATEISSALSYMHSAANVSIFHRDIKSLNILLDEKLMVKVSDFGASRMIDFDQTHVSTNIQGTLGYLDPEYMQTGQLTEKSDIYSLGVILLELLMGEKPSSKASSVIEGNMISRFFSAYKNNQLFQVLESYILEDANKEEVDAVADIAMASLSLRGQDRPTMKEVEMRLEGLMRGKKKMKKQAKHIEQFDDIDLSDTTSFLHRNGSLLTESTSREVSVVGLAPPVKGLVR